MMKVKIKKLVEAAVLPAYAHGPLEDAGMDLCAAETAILRPNVAQVVRLGFSMELPPGFEAQIRSRSGLASKSGVTVANSPGTVDPSFRGEVKVILVWSGQGAWDFDPRTKQPWWDPNPRFAIAVGDRIAQMVIARYEPVEVEEEYYLSETTRGEGGFGSTGIGKM